MMKRCLGLLIASLFLAVPMMMAQSSDHVEVGVFVDYFRLNNKAAPVSNFLGLGGRAAINMNSSVQLEAEMAYDFKKNYTSIYSNGVSSTTVNSSFRTLHGFFGPKLQTGSGPFRIFVTGKVGFDNFSISHQNPRRRFRQHGWTHQRRDLLRGLSGWLALRRLPDRIGLRAEIGDDIYFNGGARNNVRITFGPQLRF